MPRCLDDDMSHLVCEESVGAQPLLSTVYPGVP